MTIPARARSGASGSIAPAIMLALAACSSGPEATDAAADDELRGTPATTSATSSATSPATVAPEVRTLQPAGISLCHTVGGLA